MIFLAGLFRGFSLKRLSTLCHVSVFVGIIVCSSCASTNSYGSPLGLDALDHKMVGQEESGHFEMDVAKEYSPVLGGRSAMGMRGFGSGGGGAGRMAIPAEDTSDVSVALLPSLEEQGERQKIYTGHISLLVASVDDARETLFTRLEANGAYIASQHNSHYEIRVPATQFASFRDEVKELGRVVDERVDVKDVTRQVYELNLRLSNARLARERLVALMAKAEQTKDVLEIERELRRLTEEIELMEGNMRSLRDRIAYSTLHVELNSNAPPSDVGDRQYSPHFWIRQAGPEAVWHMSTQPKQTFSWVKPIVLPDNFLLLSGASHRIRAISSDESRLHIEPHEVAGGNQAFWEKALIRDLEENRGLVFEREIELAGGPWKRARIYDATVQGQPVKYVVAVAYGSRFLSSNRTLLMQFVAHRDHFEEDLSHIEQALQTVRGL